MKKHNIIQLFKTRHIGDNKKGYNQKGLNVSTMLMHLELVRRGFNSSYTGVIDDNDIDRVIYFLKPTHLILNAFWYRPEKIELLCNKYKEVKFFLRCHSKLNFLAMEGNGIKRLLEYISLSENYKNVFVASNSYEMVKDVQQVFDKHITWIPNLYFMHKPINYNLWTKNSKAPLKIGIFCAMRPFKNIITQAGAAVSIGEKLNVPVEIHIITGREEMGGHTVVNSLKQMFDGISKEKAKIIEYPWLCHNDFLELISKMHIGLQVTYTESFNIIAADFLSQNKPVMVSPSVAYLPNWIGLNPDNLENIADNTIRILNSKFLQYALITYGKYRIRKWNRLAADQIIDIVNNY